MKLYILFGQRKAYTPGGEVAPEALAIASPHYYDPAGCELIDQLKLFQSDPCFVSVRIMAVELPSSMRDRIRELLQEAAVEGVANAT